jgi:site-specific DNA-methyltransferase (adenine-specific)
MKEFRDKIICGDCIKVLGRAKEPFADLVFADPPFNIGYKYDGYNDLVKREKYIGWTEAWMTACKKVLKPHGSFYVAIGDDYAADVKMAADKLHLILRNWIIWHYTFGQQTKNKFARSHTHIFYFVNDKKNFTFNDHAVRVFSDRQRKYYDRRANPAGKMPNDVWDEYPRVCGTFKERLDFPCQMPESLLARIIRVSSNEGDWILDPFIGSGTTAAVAAKLGRYFTGIDISQEYVEKSKERVQACGNLTIEGEENTKWNARIEEQLKWLYHENKIPSEQLEHDPLLLTLFTGKFNERIGATKNPFQAKQIIKHLIQMRKSAKLGPLRGHSVPRKSRKHYSESPLWEIGDTTR